MLCNGDACAQTRNVLRLLNRNRRNMFGRWSRRSRKLIGVEKSWARSGKALKLALSRRVKHVMERTTLYSALNVTWPSATNASQVWNAKGLNSNRRNKDCVNGWS